MAKGGMMMRIAMILVIVGAINWGLVGLFGFNLVEMLSFGSEILERTIYVLVGASAIPGLVDMF